MTSLGYGLKSFYFFVCHLEQSDCWESTMLSVHNYLQFARSWQTMVQKCLLFFESAVFFSHFIQYNVQQSQSFVICHFVTCWWLYTGRHLVPTLTWSFDIYGVYPLNSLLYITSIIFSSLLFLFVNCLRVAVIVACLLSFSTLSGFASSCSQEL